MAKKKDQRTSVVTHTEEELAGGQTRTRGDGLQAKLQRIQEVGDRLPLGSRGDEHEQTRAKLALMEATLLADMYGIGPCADPEEEVEVDQGVKSAILSKLSQLDD